MSTHRLYAFSTMCKFFVFSDALMFVDVELQCKSYCFFQWSSQQFASKLHILSIKWDEYSTVQDTVLWM